MAHWAKIRADPINILRTILYNGQVAGSIVSWIQDDHREVGYGVGREFWGQGIATRALRLFLDIGKDRPLFAYTAEHNIGTKRVLEKCGFVKAG